MDKNLHFSLDTKFYTVLDHLETIDNMMSNSPNYKNEISIGLLAAKQLWEDVNLMDIFSSNEDLDDLSTESIKYIIVPAIIANLLEFEMMNRKYCLDLAMTYYEKFFSMLKNFKFAVNKSTTREDKINNYREEKLNKEKMAKLRKYIEQDHIDEEDKRGYFVCIVKDWIFRASNSMKMIKDEVMMLDCKERGENAKTRKVETSTFSKFTITKEMVKQSVFGHGYKSLPTISLEEFYNMQVADGTIPPPSSQSNYYTGEVRRIVPDEEKANEEKKEKEDYMQDWKSDEQRLKNVQWDEFKDDNPKGWGNRMNRG